MERCKRSHCAGLRTAPDPVFCIPETVHGKFYAFRNQIISVSSASLHGSVNLFRNGEQSFFVGIPVHGQTIEQAGGDVEPDDLAGTVFRQIELRRAPADFCCNVRSICFGVSGDVGKGIGDFRSGSGMISVVSAV